MRINVTTTLFILFFSTTATMKAESLMEIFSEGKSQLQLRYASENSNQSLGLYIKNVYKGNLSFASSGGYYTKWSSKKTQCFLGAFNNVMVKNCGEGGAKLDYLRFNVPSQETVEMENGTCNGGAYVVARSEASGGYAVYGLDNFGATCTFSDINGGTMGKVWFKVAYASINGAILNIDITNRPSVQIDLPATDGADDYSGLESMEITSVNYGANNTISLSIISGDANIDYVSFIAAGTKDIQMETGTVGGGASITADANASGGYAIYGMENAGAYCELQNIGAPANYGYTLSANSTTDYKIVTPDFPSEPTAFAADELKNYLDNVTGANFSIVAESSNPTGKRIFVGAGSMSTALVGSSIVDKLGCRGPGDDGFLIRYINDDIVIIGVAPRGDIYGVYSFLEQEVGCRWFNWYDEEYIPQVNGNLSIITVDRIESPSLLNRDMYWDNKSGDRDQQARFLARTKLNGFVAYRFAMTGAGDQYGYPPYKYINPTVHTAFYYVAPTIYYDDPQSPNYHPEYFSTYNGVQNRYHLNWINPEMRSVLETNLENNIIANGCTGVYSVSQMDVFKDFDNSAASQSLYDAEGTNGAALFQCVANMANTFETAYPDVMLSTLAYRKHQTEVPPSTITFPNNVIVRFAAIDDDIAKSFLATNNAGTRQNLLNWPSVTSNLWIWYYPFPFPRKGALPIGNLTRWQEDFNLFSQIGIKGSFMNYDGTITKSHDMADMNIWIMNKLHWNALADMDSLITDFAGHYYGSAAPQIIKYVNKIEEATASMTTWLDAFPSSGQYRYLTNDLLLECQNIFSEAEALVANDQTLLLRINQARMNLDRACILWWNAPWRALRDHTGVNFTYSDLKTRYQDTNDTTVSNRVSALRAAESLAYVDDFIEKRDWIKPNSYSIPASLSSIPPSKIKQITADYNNNDRLLVQDSAATYEIATCEEVEESPVRTCVENPNGATHWGSIDIASIPDGNYNLYDLGNWKLSDFCFVAFGYYWKVRFPLEDFYDPQNPDKIWKIYASIRFEGDFYLHDGSSEPGKIFVDRIILVEQ